MQPVLPGVMIIAAELSRSTPRTNGRGEYVCRVGPYVWRPMFSAGVNKCGFIDSPKTGISLKNP